MGVLSRKVGIDLGSSRTRIIIPRKGVVLDQPSIVARDVNTDKIVAVGDKAFEMAGKAPESFQTHYPLQRGVIADFGATSNMLKAFLQDAAGRVHLTKPEIMISVSMTATSTEQRAVIDVAEQIGAQKVHLIQPPVAAALGAHVSITRAHGNMIIDIGAGTTEIAVLSLGGIVAKRAIRTGGRTIDDAINSNLKRSFGIVVGKNTIEKLKLKIGAVNASSKGRTMTLHGRSTIEGLPKSVKISSQDASAMITPVFDEIIRAAKLTIEQTPPELVGDIKKNGILLSGGVSQLKGLDGYLSERLNTSCSVVDTPIHSVVKGTNIALSHLEDYQRSLLSI